MQITKEPLEKSTVKLTVELTADEILPFIEKAAKKISENMDIPGFRKGQAPLEVVKQKAGEMSVLQEAAELAVQKTMPEAIKKEELETVGQPEINVDKLAPGNPFVYTAIVPLLPSIELSEISAIKVEKEKIEVTEDEVAKVIDNLRKMRASETLVDREAKKEDKVELNFKVFLNKIPVDGGSGDKYPLVLGEGSMIPGFEEKIEGMKKDEEKEFELQFPEEYHNKQLAGKKCDFQVKILGVYEVKLPEMNDEFAKSMGEYDSVNALKDAIEKNIHEEKKQKVDGKFEKDIMDKMIEGSKFGDIPEVMVNRETHSMINELEQNLAGQGVPLDEYLKHIKKDRQQLTLDFAPDAVRRIKSALIIRELAKKQGIEAPEEEVSHELDHLRHVYESNSQVIKQIESPSYREYMENVVRNKKTLHWLVEQVEKQ